MDLSPISNNLFILLFLASAVHSLFLSLLLFLKTHKEKGLGWLGFLMIPIGLMLFNYLLYLGDWMRSLPHLLGTSAPVIYLMGPAYYFFVRRSVDENHRFQWLDVLHLFPALYVFAEWWPVYQWTAEAKLAVVERMYEHRHPPLGRMILANRQMFLVLGYVVYSYLYLKNQQQQIRSNKRVRWLVRFSLFFAVFILADMAVKILFWWNGWNGTLMELLLVLLLALAIHLLGYLVLGKDKILPEYIRSFNNGKYANSPLTPASIESYKKKILAYLEKERHWLKADFSVQDMARNTGIPRHYISQVLSEGLQTNFYDLICQYRIAEVQKRLQSGEFRQYSILGIATDCGFGSKSSFNRAFKKATGVPPTEWLKSQADY